MANHSLLTSLLNDAPSELPPEEAYCCLEIAYSFTKQYRKHHRWCHRLNRKADFFFFFLCCFFLNFKFSEMWQLYKYCFWTDFRGIYSVLNCRSVDTGLHTMIQSILWIHLFSSFISDIHINNAVMAETVNLSTETNVIRSNESTSCC